MAFFDRFKSKKQVRPVGQNLERGRNVDAHAFRNNMLVKGAIFLVLVVITLAAFPRAERYDYFVQPGEVWRKSDLMAPFDFAIFKSPETIEAEKRQIRFRVPPLFRAEPDVDASIAARRDSLARQLDRVFSAFSQYRQEIAADQHAQAIRDSMRYDEIRRNSWLKLTPEQWHRLATGSTNVQPNGQPAPLASDLGSTLLQAAFDVSREVADHGVLDVPTDSVFTDLIISRSESERIDEQIDVSEVYGLERAHSEAEQALADRFPDQPESAALAGAMFRAMFEPSYTFLRGESLREWQRQESRISPTQGIVRQGEVIVREGDRVTEDVLRKLASLARVQDDRGGNTLLWKVTAGQLLLTITTYVLFFLYLFLLRRAIFEDNRQVLLIALLFIGIVALYALAIRLPSVAMLAVPVGIASVLLTVVFDSRVGIFGTLALALTGAHLLHYDFEFAFATIFAGALGVFSVRDIKNRGQFFLSAGLVFIGYLATQSASWLVDDAPSAIILRDLTLIGINSFFLIIAYPLLWVFERAFDVTTDLTLLELSDTNRPLLKEVSLRAPGTFNHSLQVANLAEAAADAVGANALLTRVGALYHDIGKMLKPEYFVENQRPGDNPHDHLKPRMSALIIASHVKEGLEMGRQYRLPQRVLRFIPMHHGTTRIEYFYRKAIDQRGPEEAPVQESEFRYPGPQPDSKETGILMLADSVEAASRSLSEPTHKRLETLIDMIFKARIEDGQLDQTLLTFRDLSVIKETFLSLLVGIYHVRVKYPGQEKESAKQTAPEKPQAGDGAPAERAADTSRVENDEAKDEVPEHAPAEGDDRGLNLDPSKRALRETSEFLRTEKDRPIDDGERPQQG